MNEFSELQAVDFGLGAFIAQAYTGMNPEVGPRKFREFLTRPVNRQIYRHDTDSPAQFVKDLQAAKKTEREVAGGKIVNQVELPVIYYYRKPGMSNVDDVKSLRGRYSYSDERLSAFNFLVLPLVLDYTMVFLAWDKPSMDKLELGWYAHISRHDRFNTRYRIGEEEFDVLAIIGGHTSILLSDITSQIGPEFGRMYAVSTGLQVSTQVIYGAGVFPPEEITISGVLASHLDHETGEPRLG